MELAKQGKTDKALHEYDVASAYPSISVQLPSMKGGQWIEIVNPTREDVFNASALSMFHVRTHHFERDLLFYSFPYRTEDGSIMFPNRVNGYYMRDDVIAGFKWFDVFERRKRLCNYGFHPEGASIELVSAWIFVPATDEKPFAWVKKLFDYRASLPKNDIRGDVVKLGINCIYGKLAQRVGRRGQPPKFVGPWHAAAITAGTRRVLIEAAIIQRLNPGLRPEQAFVLSTGYRDPSRVP